MVPFVKEDGNIKQENWQIWFRTWEVWGAGGTTKCTWPSGKQDSSGGWGLVVRPGGAGWGGNPGTGESHGSDVMGAEQLGGSGERGMQDGGPSPCEWRSRWRSGKRAKTVSSQAGRQMEDRRGPAVSQRREGPWLVGREKQELWAKAVGSVTRWLSRKPLQEWNSRGQRQRWEDGGEQYSLFLKIGFVWNREEE